MKNLQTIVFLTLISFSFSMAQTQQATTTDGKKVTLSPNGTWKYNEPKPQIPQANSTSSDCSSWISITTDKMTGVTSTAAINTLVVSTDGGKKGFGIFLMQSSKGGLIISIQAAGAGSCIEEGAKINILFTDGSKLELASENDFNCKGKATIYFGDIFGKKSELAELKSKRIQTMRVWTSDSFVEKDFTKANQDEFFHVINCLTK
jgi:hypothetical protein